MSQETHLVAINAQLLPGEGKGGIEMVLIALISALGRLDGPEHYAIVGPWQKPDWLTPYLGLNQHLVAGPRPGAARQTFWYLKQIAGPLRQWLVRGGARLRSAGMRRAAQQAADPLAALPRSDGFFERLGAEIVHFPFQEYMRVNLPTLYNPHDLLHLHYPEFFTREQLALRALMYAPAAQAASLVVAGSHWMKQDFVEKLDLSPDKVQVIPWAPPTQVYQMPDEDVLVDLRERLGLRQPYAYYPAPLRKNKNHLRLLEAVALLRDRGVELNLVCSGFIDAALWPEIEAHIHSLRLERQVIFTGHLPGEQLRALYHLSQFVVIPTLFEAASGPMFEAWQEGVPVCCSNVTSLPEQAAGAALIFDPLDVPAIADAMGRMSTDAELRSNLRWRGGLRLQDFSWERTARAYRAAYRRVAGWPLSAEDHELLGWDWMREKERHA